MTMSLDRNVESASAKPALTVNEEILMELRRIRRVLHRLYNEASRDQTSLDELDEDESESE